MIADRHTAEHYVPITGALVQAVLAEAEFHFEFVGKKLGLMIPPMMSERMTQHFLKRNDIRIDLPQNISDALGRILAVDANAFMDVVSCDPETMHQLFR